jgi:IS30 family transposase
MFKMKTYHQLTQEERYHIGALSMQRLSISEIARRLGRSKSTISREKRRNATNHDGFYRAEKAQSYSTARRKRSRRNSHFSPEDWALVRSLIIKRWSPEQISGYLKKEGLLRISHESIYRYLLKDKKKGGYLFEFMRIMPKCRRKRYNSKDSRGRMQGKRHICERPLSVEARTEIGHWEGDTVIGKDKKYCILTLVERKTGFTIIRKLAARNKEQVNRQLTQILGSPPMPFKTITFDNGTEFHDFALIEKNFPVECYFATPYHSWERGTNENTNGLIRQYLPKGSCMKRVSQMQCDEIAHALNSRPRKRHLFKTPLEILYASETPLHFKVETKRNC